MRNFIPALALAVTLAACVGGEPRDTQGPKLQRHHLAPTTPGGTGWSLVLEWDEPLGKATADGDFAPQVPVKLEETRLLLGLPSGLRPGKEYHWSVSVGDKAGNPTSLQGKLLGPNEHPAGVRLNEVRFAGTGDKPDAVEVLVTQAGNLGGLTLDYRGPGTHQDFVFPDTEVAKGALLVVLYKPGTSAAGKVFFQPAGKGLSAVTGLLTLRTGPGEAPLDAFAWALRAGEARKLATAAGVPLGEGQERSPQGTTATRTWCRGTADTWMIVASGKSSIGRANTLVPWKPKPSSRKPVRSSNSAKSSRSRRSSSPICPVARSRRGLRPNPPPAGAPSLPRPSTLRPGEQGQEVVFPQTAREKDPLGNPPRLRCEPETLDAGFPQAASGEAAGRQTRRDRRRKPSRPAGW